MKVLIIDTETSGLKVHDSHMLEIAALLYSVPLRTTLQQWSTLIYAPQNPAEHINHIKQDWLNEIASVDTQPETFFRMAFEADAFMGYNVKFDKPFVLRWAQDTLVDGKPLPNIPWVCAYEHLKGFKSTPNRKLSTIAAAYDIPIKGAHRALFDCQLVAELLPFLPDLEEQLLEIIQRSY